MFFRVAGNHRLHLHAEAGQRGTGQLLAALVKQNPADLRTHLQRIFLLAKQGGEAALFGALVDLFIVLGEAGEPLKHRCLNVAEPVLTVAHLTFLEASVADGLSAMDTRVAQARHSVLALGYTGGHRLVSRRERMAGEYGCPYDEALGYLEYGQVEPARKVLEAAMERGVDDPRITRQLYEIYRHAQDAAAIGALDRRLGKVSECS